MCTMVKYFCNAINQTSRIIYVNNICIKSMQNGTQEKYSVTFYLIQVLGRFPFREEEYFLMCIML